MSISMLRVRWLFFDLGDTLWRSSTPESRQGLYPKVGRLMRDWLEACGHHQLPADALLAERIWNAVDAAEARPYYPTAIAEVVQATLAALDIPVSVEDGEALWRLAQAPAPERGCVLLDGAANTLKTLKQRGMRLGVITNRTFDEAFTRHDLSALGLDGLFEHVIVSADVGYRKPHPHIFQAALYAAGARPQDCALIGDNMRADIQGAQDSGLLAIWKRSTLTATDRPVTPDAVIECLSDLLDLLEMPPSQED